MMRIPLAVFAALTLLSYVAQSQSCTEYTKEVDCNLLSDGSCKWVTNAVHVNGGSCQCKSNVKLDILFAVDTSGSIGHSGFQIQKQFLKTLVLQGINNGSKIGFVMFSTKVNFSRHITTWTTTELETYVSGLYWKGGYTNTPDTIQQALYEFQGQQTSYVPDPERQQILIMITDGNPCLPESLGGCPQSVCQYAAQIKAEGIRVLIIGVGDGLNTIYVKCLTQSDDDFIPVASFSTSDFESIMGSLSGVLCPVAKDFKVTEVKAMKKSGALNNRLPRFVEFYNNGVEFDLSGVYATGLITMSGGGPPGVTVPQGTYVVFYDAADGPFPSMPSCHLCGTDCTLTSCSIASESSATGYCWCQNSIYVACGNDASSDCSQGMNADAGVLPSDGCSLCTFDDDMTKTSWNIQFTESTGTLIDGVTYTGVPEWITTTDGFSYELISKGLNNDYGANWAETCSILGTPGADPVASCEKTCVTTNCNGLGSCNGATGMCDCTTDTGLYPQCTSPTVCATCAQIPDVGDCYVTWIKNGTTRKATYEWSLAQRDSSTRYVLSTRSGSGGIKTIGERSSWETDGCDTCLYQPIYVTTDYDSNTLTDGGYVQVAIDACYWYLDNGENITSCDVYLGPSTICTVITSAPTSSPTPAPTDPPTRDPTKSPTPPPTFPCPEVHWLGGTQQKICKKQERCNCGPDGANDCCLLDPIFEANTYDTNRQHKPSFACFLDVQKENWQKDNEEDAGTSPGYLLTTQDHFFAIKIKPDDFDCAMDICWRFEWTNTNCNYDPDDRRRRLQGCDAGDTSLEQAGLAIDNLGGCLHPDETGNDDAEALTVKFTVSRLDCEEDDDDADRRRLAQASDCYENIAIYGRMVIVNATQACNTACYDGRIYPMEIPVWFNYADALYIPPGQEKTLPPWLWWLIAAMALFLCVLALLLYKYWWKSQATGAALDGVQKDLDQAVYESEVGFGNGLQGNQVGFNPLATGFNPNAPAGNGVPNRPPDGAPGGGNFIRPNVERPVFKQEYGQQTGNLR